jgi:hypothetical protein
MPKATVKLQQTQPLPQAPAASVKTTSLSSAVPVIVNEADPLVLWASVAVCVASLAAAILGYLTFSACA